MRVACRWPGGMDIAVHRGTDVPPLVVSLNGPVGTTRPQANFIVGGGNAQAAVDLNKSVASITKDMQRTASDAFTPTDYGVTEVPDDFWAAWFSVHSGLEVVLSLMVFAL